jgi:hypothetical protein
MKRKEKAKYYANNVLPHKLKDLSPDCFSG